MRSLAIISLLAALFGGCASSDIPCHGHPRIDEMAGGPTAWTPSDNEVAVQHTFDAPRQRVWDAWTSCEHLRQWMLGPSGWSMTVCEIDLRPGGSQRLAWRDAESNEMEIRGTYQEVQPPSRLIVREAWGGDWPETTNTLALAETHGRTTMTLTIRYPSKEARDAALATGMQDGMAHSFQRAAQYIQSIR
jgi:uncharacterized protein YndB with AHSA1/START domain